MITYIRLASDNQTIIGIVDLPIPVEEIPNYPDPGALRALTAQELTDNPGISTQTHYIDVGGDIAEYSNLLKAKILQAPIDYAAPNWNVNTGWVDVAPLAARNFKAASNATTEMRTLLDKSEWSQSADVPAPIRSVFAAYRTALRRISAQPGYPGSFTWPTRPVFTLSRTPTTGDINEGSSLMITLTAPDLSDGDTVDFILSGTGLNLNDIFVMRVNGSTITKALTGSFVIDSGISTLQIIFTNDTTPEGLETIEVCMPDLPKAAPLLVNINDTSV